MIENLASHFGIALPGERHITHRVSSVEPASPVEHTEVYSTTGSPVRAMNDVIDHLLLQNEVVDLSSDATLPVVQRSLVQLEAELTLSPATEIGSLMSAAMPIFMKQAATGGSMEDVDPSMFASAVIQSGGLSLGPHVYNVISDVEEYDVFLIADPTHLVGRAAMDDLEDECTIFGIVDRIISEGSSYSLERVLLPGMNRTMRRALSRNSLSELVASFRTSQGNQADAADISIDGPAIQLLPIAIY